MATNRVRPYFYDPTNASCPTREMREGTDCIYQEMIRDGDISTAKIANNAVTSSKILDGAVTTNKIQDGAVNSAKIANGSITTTDIQIRAISQDLLANDAVGRNQLDFTTGTVTSSGRAVVLTATNELTTAEIGGSGGGGLTSVNSDDTLSGDGTSGNALGVSDALRNMFLLINGFLILTRDTDSDMGTRMAWVGQLPGFDTTQQTYYFDSSDSSWYDVSSGGRALIGF